jgi:hypothetical protein
MAKNQPEKELTKHEVTQRGKCFVISRIGDDDSDERREVDGLVDAVNGETGSASRHRSIHD